MAVTTIDVKLSSTELDLLIRLLDGYRSSAPHDTELWIAAKLADYLQRKFRQLEAAPF